MSNGVNKAILIGNVGQDPDVRTSEKGRKVARINIATAEVYKDRDGNKQETTEWHRVVAFDKAAEVIEKYVQKGTQLYVEGKNKTNSYVDKDDIRRYSKEVHIQNLNILNRGVSNKGSQQDSNLSEEARKNEEKVYPSQSRSAADNTTPSDNDDLPF